MKEYLTLERFLVFLRHDFDSPNVKTVTERMRDIQFEWSFWTSFDPAYDWLEDARALQTEIAHDLPRIPQLRIMI